MTDDSTIESEWNLAREICQEAAQLVLRLRDSFHQSRKDDGSIVTSADIASAELIRARLSAAFPEDCILTEEDPTDSLERLHYRRCWIADPIDGTTAYASGSSDFDVYLALIEEGRPRIVVAHQPVTGQVITAARGLGAWRFADGTSEEVRWPAPPTPAVIVSRHWLGSPANLESVQQFARIAGGVATSARSGISPRTFLQPGVDAIVGISVTEQPISAKEWDVAPLDLIVTEAGGWSSDLFGKPLQFNKAVPNFPTGLVLARTRELGRKLIAAIAEAADSPSGSATC